VDALVLHLFVIHNILEQRLFYVPKGIFTGRNSPIKDPLGYMFYPFFHSHLILPPSSVLFILVASSPSSVFFPFWVQSFVMKRMWDLRPLRCEYFWNLHEVSSGVFLSFLTFFMLPARFWSCRWFQLIKGKYLVSKLVLRYIIIAYQVSSFWLSS